MLILLKSKDCDSLFNSCKSETHNGFVHLPSAVLEGSHGSKHLLNHCLSGIVTPQCCPTLHTLHPTPDMPHPTPYTLHPTPYTVHHCHPKVLPYPLLFIETCTSTLPLFNVFSSRLIFFHVLHMFPLSIFSSGLQ